MQVYKRRLTGTGESFFLFGPRGTGKSTWIGDVYPSAPKIDLLDTDILFEYQSRPERLAEFVAGHPDHRTFVVDEVQKAPELLSVVHRLMEERKTLRFVLTGSSARKLKREGTDLLGGRALRLTMHPFLAAELGADFSLEDAIRFGMLPVVHGAEDRRRKLSAYVDMYLKEEIQQEGLVRNLGPFTRFLQAISFSHAAQLSVSDVARDCGVKRSTVDGYLGILYDLLIASLLPVFSKRAKRELAVRGKFYFFDAGVFRSIRPRGALDRPEEIDGAALEGLVFQQLRTWLDYRDEADGLYFWRTRSGVEVDFVVYTPTTFRAVEVKNAAKFQPRDLRGLKAFMEDYPEAEAFLLYRGKERLRVDGVNVVPLADFLLSLD